MGHPPAASCESWRAEDQGQGVEVRRETHDTANRPSVSCDQLHQSLTRSVVGAVASCMRSQMRQESHPVNGLY